MATMFPVKPVGRSDHHRWEGGGWGVGEPESLSHAAAATTATTHKKNNKAETTQEFNDNRSIAVLFFAQNGSRMGRRRDRGEGGFLFD